MLTTNQYIVIFRNTSKWKEKTLKLIFLIVMVVLPSIATFKNSRMPHLYFSDAL